MSATELDIQEQMKNTEIPSLKDSIFRTLLLQLGKNPGFFKSKSTDDPVPYVINDMLPIWQERLAKLLNCAGFGRRQDAETIFKAYPALLLWRGKLTDIAKKVYEDITAFEYAVKVKDSYFVKKVVDFLETYQGKDKIKIAADLLEQFDRSFSKERLASVNRYLGASKAWCTAFPNRTLAERDQHFVQDVGEAQACFEAHILHEFCHPTRSFDPTPKFNENDLPEILSFYNWNSFHTDSLLSTCPGVAGNFALWRGRASLVGTASGVRAFACGARVDLEIDCAAVDALDKERTTDLLALRKRLVSILTPVDSLEPHTATLSCSSSVSL